MDLRTIEAYACISERVVREWIHLPTDPLPAVQVNGGKILINKTQFDRWLESHPYLPLHGIDVEQITNNVLKGLEVRV